MGSGKLKPSSCPALPSPSWLKQEDRAAGEAQGMAKVEHASSKDPAPHWSRFVMPWMAFCSIVEYQKFFVVVQVNVTPVLSSESGILPGEILSLFRWRDKTSAV